ncbi:MAG TPA: hypothetical protein VF331_02835 [Polyangiales bacterium]
MMNTRWFAASCAAVLLAACSARPNSAGGSSGAGTSGGGAGTGTGNTAGSGATKSADGVGDPCTVDGATRSCCGTGKQTCAGTVEFKMYGPCLDTTGKQITCTVPNTPGGCGVGEFGPTCPNGGVDGGTAPHVCGAGEFGPQCTNKTSDAGTPRVCGVGEFGPQCVGDGGVPNKLPALCADRAINTEPQILAAYSPAMGQSVGQNGQIKVWMNDECPEIIAPNEQIDPNTGLITAPGDRTAKAADGYLWEPALYIAPLTAEAGGPAHFPQYIKGWYNSQTTTVSGSGCRRNTTVIGTQVPGADPAPAGTPLPERFNTEIIWDVKSLGLTPGTYVAEFVIHDGDKDRGVGCVTITITN